MAMAMAMTHPTRQIDSPPLPMNPPKRTGHCRGPQVPVARASQDPRNFLQRILTIKKPLLRLGRLNCDLKLLNPGNVFGALGGVFPPRGMGRVLLEYLFLKLPGVIVRPSLLPRGLGILWLDFVGRLELVSNTGWSPASFLIALSWSLVAVIVLKRDSGIAR